MGTFQFSNNDRYQQQQPVVGYIPPFVLSPAAYTAINQPPAKADSFNKRQSPKKKETAETTVNAQSKASALVAPAKPNSISAGVALLGGLALLVTGGVGTYFTGKHLDWFKAGKSASAEVSTVVKEVLPKELETVFEKLGLKKDAPVEDIVSVMEKLKADINTLKTDNAKTVADSENSIKNLQAQLIASKSTTGEVGTLNADKEALQQALATLQAEVEILTEALAEKAQYVKQIEQKTTENDEALETLKAQMEKLQAHLQLSSESTASQPKNTAKAPTSATQQAGKIARITTPAETEMVQAFNADPIGFITSKETSPVKITEASYSANRKNMNNSLMIEVTNASERGIPLVVVESREPEHDYLFLDPARCITGAGTTDLEQLSLLFVVPKGHTEQMGKGVRPTVVKPAIVSKDGVLQQKGELSFDEPSLRWEVKPAQTSTVQPIPPSAPTVAGKSAGVNLSTLEQQMVDEYNEAPAVFTQKLKKYKEPQGSLEIRMREKKAIPQLSEENIRGSLALIKSADQYYLAPSNLMILNDYNASTSAVSEINYYFNVSCAQHETIGSARTRKVVKFAKVDKDLNLIEKGEIRFE